MSHASIKRFLFLFLAIMPSLTMILAWLIHRWAKLDSSWPYFWGAMGNLCALVGLPLLVVMILTGIHYPRVERTFGLDRLMRFHKILGPVVVALFLLHAILRFVKISMLSQQGWQWDFLFSLNAGGIKEWGLDIGRLAILGLLLGAGFAKLSRFSVPHHLWKPFHFVMYIVVPAGFVHSKMIGDDIALFPYNIIWYGLAAVLLVAVGYRMGYLSSRNKRFVWNLINVTPETHDTKTLVLERKQGPGAFDLRMPGQFATLRIRRSGRWGEPRPFTISCDPSSDHLCFTIKKIGKYTSALHGLGKDTKILCQGPFGVFAPDFNTEKKMVMIAGGVGITPFLSIIRHVSKSEKDCEIILIVSNKTRADIIAADELQGLATQMQGKMKVVFVISREKEPHLPEETESDKITQGHDPFVVEYGRVNEALFRAYIEPKGAVFYLCGPGSMQKSVLGALKKAFGIKPCHVRRELFYW